jgi:hypothetical protein
LLVAVAVVEMVTAVAVVLAVIELHQALQAVDLAQKALYL